MNDEKLKSSLSAIMDDQADELEIRRLLAEADAEVMATWSRYQLASAVLRKEPVFPELDMVSAVSKAIADDDLREVEAKRAKKTSLFFTHLGKFAVAASILLVTLSTVYLFSNDDFATTATSAYAQNEITIENIDVAAADDIAVDQKVSELVKKHDKQGTLTIEEKAVEKNQSIRENTN